jgi:hypothetical protein
MHMFKTCCFFLLTFLSLQVSFECLFSISFSKSTDFGVTSQTKVGSVTRTCFKHLPGQSKAPPQSGSLSIRMLGVDKCMPVLEGWGVKPTLFFERIFRHAPMCADVFIHRGVQ